MSVTPACSGIPEFVSPVRTANEGSGLDVHEACLDGYFFVSCKFFRRYKTTDRQMIRRGLEVLADSQTIASCYAPDPARPLSLR